MVHPYTIIKPQAETVPILLSVPHCGTDFPDELKDDFKPELAKSPDDTDYYVHDLYNFCSEMGITIIHAKYSRWVIDLNRDPESKALYNDGRIITALCPNTNFFGDSIYVSQDKEPNHNEVQRRLNTYYWPYYKEIENQLAQLKSQFGKALLWDAHSIRRFVPTIRKENFPDLILGNNDGLTADQSLIDIALDNLGKDKYGLNHNTPFKGGHITRYFGNPSNNIHALQLEMSKDLYMNHDETEFHMARANEMRVVLKSCFRGLIEGLYKL